MGVERVEFGNEKILAERLEGVRQSVYAYILGSVKDNVLAKDLLQDTLMKAYLGMQRGGYRDDGRFDSWVIRVARNVVIDYYRERKRAGLVELRGDWHQHQLFLSRDRNPEDELISSQDRAMVKSLVRSLPEKQQEVVLLRHYVGMSFQEIADHTGVSINTALGRMRYAMINLRKLHAMQEVA